MNPWRRRVKRLSIIPVAKVAYGFGGGCCEPKGNKGNSKEGNEGDCGGMGGGVAVKPVGIIEVTKADSRFIPFGVKKKLAFSCSDTGVYPRPLIRQKIGRSFRISFPINSHNQFPRAPSIIPVFAQINSNMFRPATYQR